MNKLYEFDYNETHYEVCVSMSVRLALTEYQHKKERLNLSDELLEILPKFNLEKDGTVDIKKLDPSILTAMAKNADTLQAAEVDELEVFKLMLQTQHKFTDEQYNEIMDMLEEKEGSLELCEVIGKTVKSAFTITEQMNKALKQEKN